MKSKFYLLICNSYDETYAYLSELMDDDQLFYSTAIIDKEIDSE